MGHMQQALAALVLLAAQTVVADRLQPHVTSLSDDGERQRGAVRGAAPAASRRRLLFTEKDHTDLYTVRTRCPLSLKSGEALRHRPRTPDGRGL